MNAKLQHKDRLPLSVEPDLSLRDHFALEAFLVLLKKDSGPFVGYDILAIRAYAAADSLLKVRGNQ